MGGAGRSEHAPVLSRIRVVVRGRVQGVFFRASCSDQARAHGLAGWVRNNPDGTVEAVFQGPRTQVQAMLDWCHHGPPAARVDGVEVAWETPVEDEGSFSGPW